jgi:hypothetical protein
MKKLFYTLLFLSFNMVFTSKAFAATISLFPETETQNEGCYYETQIIINTEGKISNSADVEISFDPKIIEVIDSNPDVEGIQISTGDAYEVYVYNLVNNETGQIKIAAGSFISSLNGSRIFATIKYRPKQAVNLTTFKIIYSNFGNTLDSNVAEKNTNNDILSSVTNAEYSIITGSCTGDIEPPKIQYIFPVNGQNNVAADSTITFKISDNLSGVDLEGLIIFLNEIRYEYKNPLLTYSGNKSEYSFSLKSEETIELEKISIMRIISSDYAGNESTDYITFNNPYQNQNNINLPDTGEKIVTCQNDIVTSIIFIITWILICILLILIFLFYLKIRNNQSSSKKDNASTKNLVN